MTKTKLKKNLFLKKKKNFDFSILNYDNFSASKWDRQHFKKKKLFNINRLDNFRNNGLSKNIDEDYINKNNVKNILKNYFEITISIK